MCSRRRPLGGARAGWASQTTRRKQEARATNERITAEKEASRCATPLSGLLRRAALTIRSRTYVQHTEHLRVNPGKGARQSTKSKDSLCTQCGIGIRLAHQKARSTGHEK